MLIIEDDGSGFDPVAGPGEGLGLLGMRERVQLLDGSLTIDAAHRFRNDARRRAAASLVRCLATLDPK